VITADKWNKGRERAAAEYQIPKAEPIDARTKQDLVQKRDWHIKKSAAVGNDDVDLNSD
jgi:hypothetical protein